MQSDRGSISSDVSFQTDGISAHLQQFYTCGRKIIIRIGAETAVSFPFNTRLSNLTERVSPTSKTTHMTPRSTCVG